MFVIEMSNDTNGETTRQSLPYQADTLTTSKSRSRFTNWNFATKHIVLCIQCFRDTVTDLVLIT